MRAVGFVIFMAAIIGFIAYAYLLLASEWSLLILKLTILGLIGLIAALLAFIGLNMTLAKERS
jgi:hypothetical protein